MKELYKPEDNVFQRLLNVQKTAKAPREISGKFGKGRSAEQILEAYKPVCNDNGLYLNTSDVIVSVGDRHYVTTTATVTNIDKPEETHSASASAWEGNIPLSNSGSEILDTSQVSGKTSSYAKKYALQNLFAIDDTKDADRDDETVVYNSRPVEKVAKRQDNVATAEPFKTYQAEDPDGSGQTRSTVSDLSELDRAKIAINEALEGINYEAPVQKKAFIMKVLKKSTIDNLDEANEVMDAIEKEA